MEDKEIYKGLAGVPVDYTAISKVNPETNSLLYRGYPVQELAANCTFEEVAYLLWHGELPNPQQLAEFENYLRQRIQGTAPAAAAKLPIPPAIAKAFAPRPASDAATTASML